MMDANVLFRQLGGNRFRAMTGAKDFMKDGNSLRMKIMKIIQVVIILLLH